MKRWLLLLLLIARAMAQVVTYPGLQTDNHFTGMNQFDLLQMDRSTVAGLASMRTADGVVVIVTDGYTNTDCVSGGGAFRVFCHYNGSDCKWEPLGGSGGGPGTNNDGILNPLNFPGADICAQIQNAINSITRPGGGTVQIPPGNYSSCAGSGGVAIAMNHDSVVLRGGGTGSPMGALRNTGSTTLNIAAGVTGIDITGSNNSVTGIFLKSNSTVAGTDDGIRIRAGAAGLRQISVKGFGRTGIRVDSGSIGGAGADLMYMDTIQSTNNFGDGFRWVCPYTGDNGVASLVELNSALNQGWGYYIDCGNDNYFLTTHATQNQLGGYFVNSAYNTFENTYAETGVGSSFVIAPGMSGIRVHFNLFGEPTTITNGGGTPANEIEYYSAEGWPVRTAFHLGDMPGAANNTTYRFNSGTDRFNNPGLGHFTISDQTNYAYVLDYDPVAKISYFPSASTGLLNVTASTTGATSWSSGSGSIPALPANSAGFAGPASGGTSYLLKMPATVVSGHILAASPSLGPDGVWESQLTFSGLYANMIAPKSGNYAVVASDFSSDALESLVAHGVGRSTFTLPSSTTAPPTGTCIFVSNENDTPLTIVPGTGTTLVGAHRNRITRNGAAVTICYDADARNYRIVSGSLEQER